jgi:hypothetical protein
MLRDAVSGRMVPIIVPAEIPVVSFASWLVPGFGAEQIFLYKEVNSASPHMVLDEDTMLDCINLLGTAPCLSLPEMTAEQAARVFSRCYEFDLSWGGVDDDLLEYLDGVVASRRTPPHRRVQLLIHDLPSRKTRAVSATTESSIGAVHDRLADAYPGASIEMFRMTCLGARINRHGPIRDALWISESETHIVRTTDFRLHLFGGGKRGREVAASTSESSMSSRGVEVCNSCRETPGRLGALRSYESGNL